MTARFLSEDTYIGEKNDPLSLNLYTYCSNNPIVYFDPAGHKNTKLGDKGNNVQAIQITLIRDGYLKDEPDGKFGTKTQAAVKAFQKDHTLKQDGIVGEKTLSAMYGTTVQPKGSNENGYFVPNTEPVKGKATNTPTPTKSNNTDSNIPTGSNENKKNKEMITYTITGPSAFTEDIPNYPVLNRGEAFLLGIDKSTGGLFTGALNMVIGLTGGQVINQEVIDYNNETTYEFKDSYLMGQGVGILGTIGALVKGVTYQGAPNTKTAVVIINGGEFPMTVDKLYADLQNQTERFRLPCYRQSELLCPYCAVLHIPYFNNSMYSSYSELICSSISSGPSLFEVHS